MNIFFDIKTSKNTTTTSLQAEGTKTKTRWLKASITLQIFYPLAAAPVVSSVASATILKTILFLTSKHQHDQKEHLLLQPSTFSITSLNILSTYMYVPHINIYVCMCTRRKVRWVQRKESERSWSRGCELFCCCFAWHYFSIFFLMRSFPFRYHF